MRSLYDEYGKRYPELCFDLLCFFCDTAKESEWIKRFKVKASPTLIKCVMDFVDAYKDIYKTREGHMIQPKDVALICKKLAEFNYLSAITFGSINNHDGSFDSYSAGFGRLEKLKPLKDVMIRKLNGIVYGKKYIYENNKQNVLPIFVEGKLDKKTGKYDNKQYVGSCVRTMNGIVTAKHCIDGYKEVAIKGMSAEELRDTAILTRGDMDLVLIVPKDYAKSVKGILSLPMISDGEVLDKIMVMGYPSHGGFDNFITTTSGEIAAIENCYIYKHELMLLTCATKGGNSGGPVFNACGEIVGIVTETSIAEGDNYDDFGYGIAVPSKYISEIARSNEEFIHKINFIDSPGEAQ